MKVRELIEELVASLFSASGIAHTTGLVVEFVGSEGTERHEVERTRYDRKLDAVVFEVEAGS